MARDWAAARQNKDAYWGERIARLGPAEGLRIAEELRRQVLSLDPDWPHDRDGERGLDESSILRPVHLEVAEQDVADREGKSRGETA